MPSASGGIARLVCERLRERGIPAAPLLSKAGLNVEQIDNGSVRVKARSQIRILELAADALQDDLLGFHLAATTTFAQSACFITCWHLPMS